MRPPPQTLSTYDPKHASPTGRHPGKSIYDEYKTYTLQGFDLTPPSQPPVYTEEQNAAFALAIKGLAEQHPVVGKNRTARKKHKARGKAVHLARTGNKNEAFAQAIYGGIPKDALRGVEVLIYG